MSRQIVAIFLDCGDTLVDEGTEVKDGSGVSLRAELIPGAAELVRALVERGYTLALVADGPAETFTNNLGPHGLYGFFSAYAISSALGVEKPHPQMFQHALDSLNIAPADYGRVLMVGNNLERDIKGANQLGLVSVWLNWAPRRSKTPADESERPQFIIKEPLHLLDVIDGLEHQFAAVSQA